VSSPPPLGCQVQTPNAERPSAIQARDSGFNPVLDQRGQGAAALVASPMPVCASDHWSLLAVRKYTDRVPASRFAGAFPSQSTPCTLANGLFHVEPHPLIPRPLPKPRVRKILGCSSEAE